MVIININLWILFTATIIINVALIFVYIFGYMLINLNISDVCVYSLISTICGKSNILCTIKTIITPRTTDSKMSFISVIILYKIKKYCVVA